ncbi:MAG: DUF393 domain-containing protein [Leptospiraceae bacterium]|nr:DUF393 domain-containing protein [Leptospiraceae bacterium]
MTKIFLFDGDCKFCTNLASYLKDKCLNKEIKFHSFRNLTQVDLEKIHPQLTLELCLGNVQYIYNQSRYPGFFAVRKVSHSLKFYRYFSFILYLPLVPILGIIIMNLLKKWKKY